eukprot:gene27127-33810_t
MNRVNANGVVLGLFRYMYVIQRRNRSDVFNPLACWLLCLTQPTSLKNYRRVARGNLRDHVAGLDNLPEISLQMATRIAELTATLASFDRSLACNSKRTRYDSGSVANEMTRDRDHKVKSEGDTTSSHHDSSSSSSNKRVKIEIDDNKDSKDSSVLQSFKRQDEQSIQEEQGSDGLRSLDEFASDRSEDVSDHDHDDHMDHSSQSVAMQSSNADSRTTGSKSTSRSSKHSRKVILQPRSSEVGEILRIATYCEEPVPSGEVKRETFDVTYTNGDRYFGEMDGTKRHGYGKFACANQPRRWVYEGQWQNDKRHGQGTLRYDKRQKPKKTTDVYEGPYVDNMACGEGKITSHNGDVYSGGFSEDMKHGHGVFEYKKGHMTRYEGGMQANECSGQGTTWYKNGDVYTGNFQNDFPRGQGRRVNKRDEVVHEGANWRSHEVPMTKEQKREKEQRKKANLKKRQAAVKAASADVALTTGAKGSVENKEEEEEEF